MTIKKEIVTRKYRNYFTQSLTYNALQHLKPITHDVLIIQIRTGIGMNFYLVKAHFNTNADVTIFVKVAL